MPVFHISDGSHFLLKQLLSTDARKSKNFPNKFKFLQNYNFQSLVHDVVPKLQITHGSKHEFDMKCAVQCSFAKKSNFTPLQMRLKFLSNVTLL